MKGDSSTTMPYEGTLTFDPSSQQWRIRKEGVHPRDWYTVEEFAPLTLKKADSWLDGFAYASTRWGRSYFLENACTIAFPLEEGMAARCRCGSASLAGHEKKEEGGLSNGA